MLDVGRICMKIAGREAGLYCVILDNIDDNFVLITGPKTVTGVKRRRCNIDHIEPTKHKFDIQPKADDALIEKFWENSGLIEDLEIKVPVKREFKKETSQKEKK